MTKRSIKNTGFTLIELVIVIMLLALVSLGGGSIIKLSGQIFVDVSNRDELIASARFAVERLNRELRSALPNSVRVFSNTDSTIECLEYIPTVTSTVYLDIPLSLTDPIIPLTVISFDDTLLTGGEQVVVYPLTASELYENSTNSTKRYPFVISSLTSVTNVKTFSLDPANSVFSADSPTKRLYFVDLPIAYCASAGQLIRYTDYGYAGDPLSGTGVLMAEGLELAGTSFTVEGASLVRNALVDIKLQFTKNGEIVNFYNQVQVLNVP
jgi:MSHA biogenesis protein MshO